MQRIKVTKEIMYDIYYGKASSLKKKEIQLSKPC